MSPRAFTLKEEYDDWARERREEGSYRFGDWWFNPKLKMVNDTPVTPTMAAILEVVCKAAPYPVPMRDLAQEVGRELGYGYAIDRDSLKVHIYRLRQRIGRDRVFHVRGVGVLFVPFPVVD